MLHRSRPSPLSPPHLLLCLLILVSLLLGAEAKLTEYPGRRVFGGASRRVAPLSPRHSPSAITTTANSQAKGVGEGSGIGVGAAAGGRERKPLKIALVVEPTPFTHVSGYANRFQETLKYLANSTDDVEVVTPDDHKDAPKQFLGFKIHTIKGFRFSLYNHIYLSFDLIERRIRKTLKTFKPDLVHVTSPGFLVLIALLFARLADVPTVISYHTHLPSYAKAYASFIPGAEWLSGFLIGKFHNFADMTLVTSPQMQKELQRFGVQHVEVWQKGIDTRRFHPKHFSAEMRNALSDGNPDDPLLLYVGRLGREKNIDQLKTTLEQIPSARLALVGEGPNEETLHEHFKGTHTKFMGVLHGEALSQAFASADVFCMPSDSETLGFVVLESMASGVPVIAANAGGLPNLVDHGGTGYLVTVGDAAEFTDRVNELIQGPDLRHKMGTAARAESERWSWQEATRQLREVHYPKVLEIHRLRKSRRWSVRIYNAIKSLVGALPGRRRRSTPQIASEESQAHTTDTTTTPH